VPHTSSAVLVSLEAVSRLDAFTVEQVAREFYQQEIDASPYIGIPWAELTESERDDVRHEVRTILTIAENLETPRFPGLLGLPPPLNPSLVVVAAWSSRADPAQESWPLTG